MYYNIYTGLQNWFFEIHVECTRKTSLFYRNVVSRDFLSLLKKGWFYHFAALVATVTDWLLSRWLLPGCRWPSAVRPWWSRCSPAESNISAQSPSAPGICLPCLHTENSAAVFNHILLIKNKWLFISSEEVSTLKKRPWYVLRGQCIPSSWVWQPSADCNGSFSLEHFFKIWTSWVGQL